MVVMKWILWIVAGIVAVVSLIIKGKFSGKKVKNGRAGTNSVSTNREKELQLKCIQAVNDYYDLQPEKNEAYRKRFLNNSGVFDCMRHYRQSVAEDLDTMETVEEMQMLLRGNSLQFLSGAIKKLSKEYNWMNMTRDEYLKYLNRSFKKIGARQDKNMRMIELEEVYKKTDKILQSEKESAKKREIFEGIEKQLKSPEITDLMDFLEKPYKGCTEEEYNKKAHELDFVFGKILDDYKAKK